MSIGRLQAGQEVKIVVGYVTEVKNDVDSHAMRFFLPMTITPPIHKLVANGHFTQRNNNKEILEDEELEMTDESPAPLLIKVINVKTYH